MSDHETTLTKARRDALPDSDFAVPGQRKLPINDARHVRLGWDMVDRVQGITEEERKAARVIILQRANELGVDTKAWNRIEALALQAMSLNISSAEHVNKMPFKGILVRLEEPSDAPPGGSGGKNIVMTRAAAENNLDSLLGMAVDYAPQWDAHHAQSKIGIITSAHIEGNAVMIEGFVYAADFATQAQHIQANRDRLGFSFEARDIYVADPAEDPMRITNLTFTGAAILQKDKAAYRTTSISAHADGEIEMTKEEMAALLGEHLKPLSERLDKVEASNKEAIDKLAKDTKDQIEASAKLTNDKIEANKAVMDTVEPHAAAIDKAADDMHAAGVGADPRMGHVAVLRRMAGGMRANAAMGKVPSSFHDSMYAGVEASASAADATKIAELETKHTEALAAASAATVKAVEDATKPLKDQVASFETKIKDLEASARTNKEEPGRKTLSPEIASLLAKADVTKPEGDAKLDGAQVEKMMAAANITDPVARMTFKRKLEREGVF